MYKGWHKQNWCPVVESQFPVRSLASMRELQGGSTSQDSNMNMSRMRYITGKILQQLPETSCNQWAATRKGAMGHNSRGRPWRKRRTLVWAQMQHIITRARTTKTDILLSKHNSRRRATCQNMKHNAKRKIAEGSLRANIECRARVHTQNARQEAFYWCQEYWVREHTENAMSPVVESQRSKTRCNIGGNTGAIHEDSKALPESRGCKARRK